MVCTVLNLTFHIPSQRIIDQVTYLAHDHPMHLIVRHCYVNKFFKNHNTPLLVCELHMFYLQKGVSFKRFHPSTRFLQLTQTFLYTHKTHLLLQGLPGNTSYQRVILLTIANAPFVHRGREQSSVAKTAILSIQFLCALILATKSFTP